MSVGLYVRKWKNQGIGHILSVIRKVAKGVCGGGASHDPL